MKRVLIIYGTRPEAIKLAPLVHACQRRAADIELNVCSTGQHREMAAQVSEYFGIVPDVDLALMQPNQSLAELTSRCIAGIDRVLSERPIDLVVVQGDTTTAMCAALAAFYRKVHVVHVEAGLRTNNIYSPWPEELNRRIVSLVTALHCAPTRRAAEALAAEGIDRSTIHVTGNTVIDALLWAVERERSRQAHWSEQFSMLGDRKMVLITSHRRENFGGGLQNICAALLELATRFPQIEFVFPVHRNPSVLGPVRSMLAEIKNIHLLEPASYPAFVWLMDRAALILSDSGGVQEEAPSLRKPLIVMRDTTERPEAVEAGAAVLVGADAQRISAAATELLTDPARYCAMQIPHNPFGDGHAATRIVEHLLNL